MSNYINRNDLIELIKQMPSERKPEWADYERVIRCKDCKHGKTRKMEGAKYCGLCHEMRNDDFYCAWAERKEE